MNTTEKAIQGNLKNAIKGGNAIEINTHLRDFISNVDVDQQIDFFADHFNENGLKIDRGVLGNELKNKGVGEDEIVDAVMDLILQKSSMSEILSKAPQQFEGARYGAREILKKEIVDNKLLLSEFFKIHKTSDMKEAIGWVAGFVETEDDGKLEKLIAKKSSGEIDRRKTLKNILIAINKISLTRNAPFKANYTKYEKLEMDMINTYFDALSANKKLNAYDLIMLVPESKKGEGVYTDDYMIENKDKVMEIARYIMKAKNRELLDRLDKLTSYTYISAKSSEIDVLSYNSKKDTVLGMSITSDPTTRIEQNQFFRHAFKTMIVGMEIKKKYPKGCNNVQARNVAKELSLKIKTKGGTDSYEKPINGMVFNELVRYYFQEKGKRQEDLEKISSLEMDTIISDINEHADFIFYGESFSYANKELREELGGFLMLSYVNNLKNIGNIAIDSYHDVFNFLNRCVSAKFNRCDNNKNYIQYGLEKAVDFMLNENPDDNVRYNEGACYKDGREVIYGGIKSLVHIMKEKLERSNNMSDFYASVNNFLVSNGVDKNKSKALTKDIINRKIGGGLRTKCDGFKKGESETGQELENLITAVNALEAECSLKVILENNDPVIKDRNENKGGVLKFN